MLPSAVGEFRYGLEGRIIRCPWHGWEFDLTTGKSVFKPDRVKLKVYPVTVEPACPGSQVENEPRVEIFSVTVERQWIVLHL
jgi:3-phenylpropionate/trans-cinnamate dioxygenase ferredoxin subunit